MQSRAATVDQYIAELPADRQKTMAAFRKIIRKNLPKGFVEEMSYGMIGYVVPLSTYPAGYHVNPKLPLCFMNLASQKNNITFHHLGIYADAELLKWFTTEYTKAEVGKLDMGKGCIRFKKAENIPYKLIGELCSKLTVEKWITVYEKNIKRKV